VTNTSSADSETECHLSGCDVSIHTNDGISTLQHFGMNSCKRTAHVRQILEFCFSCFGSSHYFHPVTNSASAVHSTSINIAKMSVVISHCFFLGNKQVYHSTLFVPHIIDELHCEELLLSVRNLYNSINKCQELVTFSNSNSQLCYWPRKKFRAILSRQSTYIHNLNYTPNLIIQK
jgi:hypothetical protein